MNSKRIYIFCPAEYTSGGPLLLHQFAAAVNEDRHDFVALMVYYTGDWRLVDLDSAEPYRKYNVPHEFEIEKINKEENIVIIPEQVTILTRVFNKPNTVIWWLSVDNYVKSNLVLKNYNECGLDPLGIMSKDRWLHMVQSYYAYDFIAQAFGIDEKHAIYVSDYLDDEFVDIINLKERDNVVCYNPKKGKETIESIMELSSAKDIKWRPLINMSAEEVHEALSEAKVYVDFGNHPGKDRIPREAAISGCCVITNRLGAANYQNDVPIPDEYKFDDPLLFAEDIVGLIKDIFSDYENRKNDFATYCDMIRSEKEWFKEDVASALKYYSEFFNL